MSDPTGKRSPYIFVGHRVLLPERELGRGNFGVVYRVAEKVCSLGTCGNVSPDPELLAGDEKLACHPVGGISGGYIEVDRSTFSGSSGTAMSSTWSEAGRDIDVPYASNPSGAMSSLSSSRVVFRALKVCQRSTSTESGEERKATDPKASGDGVSSALWKEYCTLKMLDEAGVSVPKPIDYGCYLNPETNKRSAVLLMEEVEGVTLREWLNSTPGYLDKEGGRSIHPVDRTEHALTRLDVCLNLLSVLRNLWKRGGVFVDLKPRNIMINAGTNSVVLVDIGGIVMHEDFDVADSGEMLMSSANRHKMEMTSSYVSPEIVVPVICSDARRKKWSTYFPASIEDGDVSEKDVWINRTCLNLLSKGIIREDGSGRRAAKGERVILVPKKGIWAKADEKKGAGGATEVAPTSKCYSSSILGEKSIVFTLTLILVELLGGKRTGVTALVRMPLIQRWFKLRHDVEYRMLAEWELRQVPAPIESGRERKLSFKDIYRYYCYPQSGIFAPKSDGTPVQKMMLQLLDGGLVMDPDLRCTLADMDVRLRAIREVVARARKG
eukprot:GHVU01097935.1.p1 GENE.GHVU01097935.1~~GHVU01097935.1.p1  ORF type:complete len:552 (+),score=46.56 GHVU01097935.1:398-2053(+)